MPVEHLNNKIILVVQFKFKDCCWKTPIGVTMEICCDLSLAIDFFKLNSAGQVTADGLICKLVCDFNTALRDEIALKRC